MAVGETDPSCPELLEVLKEARSQAQVIPEEDRIASTESLFEERGQWISGAGRLVV